MKISTKPPKTREGKKYPGGKKMRKALANLEARIRHIPTGKNASRYRKPGSMRID